RGGRTRVVGGDQCRGGARGLFHGPLAGYLGCRRQSLRGPPVGGRPSPRSRGPPPAGRRVRTGRAGSGGGRGPNRGSPPGCPGWPAGQGGSPSERGFDEDGECGAAHPAPAETTRQGEPRMTPSPVGHGPRSLISSVPLRDFVPSWAGPTLGNRGFCFGSED